MGFKKALMLGLVLASMGAHAIPPAPPAAIYNKIKVIAARNCATTDDEIPVGELKDTESVKFVLQLNSEYTAGILSVMENGEFIENFVVTCK
ncbi:MAG: hypothetical protein ACXVLQ_03590 [Bacteriovorax sp.]